MTRDEFKFILFLSDKLHWQPIDKRNHKKIIA